MAMWHKQLGGIISLVILILVVVYIVSYDDRTEVYTSQYMPQYARVTGETVKTIAQLDAIQYEDLPEGMQMGIRQVKHILQAVVNTSQAKHQNSTPDSNLLIWGLGNDSPFWHTTTSGRTLFIEDNQSWYNQTTSKFPFLRAVKVDYFTKVSELDKYTASAEHWPELDLREQLPQWVNTIKWDVVIVDAPLGCCGEGPGRYQSIYSTSLLLNSGHVFLDDYERQAERVFGDLVFGLKNRIGVETRDTTLIAPANQQAHYILS